MTPRMRPALFLWASLVVCSFLFAPMVFMVPPPPTPPQPFMLPGLVLVAAAMAVASVLLPRQMFRKAVTEALTPLIVERANPAAEVMFREAAPPQKVFDDPQAAWAKALVANLKPSRVAVTYPMAVALMGVMAAKLGFALETGIPFLIVCWLLQIACFPTEARVAAAVKAATGVELPLGS